MELVEVAGDGDLFATECLHRLVQDEWKLPTGTGTPRFKFLLNLAALMVFLLFFAWYITDFRRTFQSWPPDLVLAAYAASFTAQEIADICNGRKLANIYITNAHCKIRCKWPNYLLDALNYFDCTALLFMWTGLLWKLAIWSCLSGLGPSYWMCNFTNGTGSANATSAREPQIFSSSAYACQMLLATSFLFWGFRTVGFLSYFERIGPAISMLRSLLIDDLVPFFAIICVIFYSFGVFIFNLLFSVLNSASPDSPGYGWKVSLAVVTLPFNMLFTNYDNIKIGDTAAEGVGHLVGQVPDTNGSGWFSNLIMFVFFVLVNIVMLNLLIARFNLTVSQMNSKALGSWRKTYFEMLREYQRISPLPPPLSFAYYLAMLCRLCILRCKRPRQARFDTEHQQHIAQAWWRKKADYREDYLKFLDFQATQFRRIRPQLSREMTKNMSDTDTLRAHTENLVSAANRDTKESLARLETNVEKAIETLHRKQTKQVETFEKTSTRLQVLEDKMDKMMELISRLS